MIFLSSNALSVDDQAADVIRYLRRNNPSKYSTFLGEFPEYWDFVATFGSYNPEYGSWVIDWIEASTSVFWLDGEPVILEDGDEDPYEDYEEDDWPLDDDSSYEA